MRKNKTKNTREKKRTFKLAFTSLAVLLALGLSAVPFNMLNDNIAYASSTASSDTYDLISELYTGGGVFDAANLASLFSHISGGNTVADVTSALATNDNAIDATKINEINNGKDVQVTLGSLVWDVVYVSKDTDGNPIATLWLSNSSQGAWSGRSDALGEYYGFVDGGLYSDWSANVYNIYFDVSTPTSMYGASYINAVTLNNGGTYVSSVSENTATAEIGVTNVGKREDSIFALFTVEQSGENNDLTDYLVTPSKVSWQTTQVTNAGGLTSHTLPNESAGALDSYDWYTDSTNGSAASMLTNQHYYSWINNYLWLPSLTETGYSDTNGYKGIWKLSDYQRSNDTGSTRVLDGTAGTGNTGETQVGNFGWLRSGDTSRASEAFSLYASGQNSTSDYVLTSRTVRPALHLNLSSAAASNTASEASVDLDDGNGAVDISELEATYDGTAKDVSKIKVTYNGTLLIKDTDYTLKILNESDEEVTEMKDVGTYKIVVTGTANDANAISYTGTLTKEFTITPKDNASNTGGVTLYVILGVLAVIILASIICWICLANRRKKLKVKNESKDK